MLDKVFMKIAEYYLRLFTLNSSGLFTDLSLILKKAEEKQFSMSRKVLIVRDFLLKHAFIEKKSNALEYFYNRYIYSIFRFVRKRFSGLHDEEIHDLVHDFLLTFITSNELKNYDALSTSFVFYFKSRLKFYILKRLRQTKVEYLESQTIDCSGSDDDDPLDLLVREYEVNGLVKALDYLSTIDRLILSSHYEFVKETLNIKTAITVNRKRLQAARDRLLFAYLYTLHMKSIDDLKEDGFTEAEKFVFKYILPRNGVIRYSADYIRSMWKIKKGQTISAMDVRKIAIGIYQRILTGKGEKR